MDKYIIDGGKRLCGEISVQGSKNSALPILFACMLCDGETVLSNLPQISDTEIALKILTHYGCSVEKLDFETVRIRTNEIYKATAPKDLTLQMRASSYLIGACIGRFGECELPDCGGCDFGTRPINMHLDALRKIGAYKNTFTNCLSVSGSLHGGVIDFKTKTVGATVNAILASVKAGGQTVINNAAKEPHIVDLCNFLNKCGANISGAGSDTINIIGTKKLIGCRHSIDGDMIEAGTFILAALACKGSVRCQGIDPAQMHTLISVLKSMGATTEFGNNFVTVQTKHLNGTSVQTEPYPGFPTDLQPQLCALLGICNGKSRITENIFKNRFAYLNEMKKCGIEYKLSENNIEISGIEKYLPADYTATDLRGGAAMVICALAANGQSTVSNIKLIERGYSSFEQKLNSLGASVIKA